MKTQNIQELKSLLWAAYVQSYDMVMSARDYIAMDGLSHENYVMLNCKLIDFDIQNYHCYKALMSGMATNDPSGVVQGKKMILKKLQVSAAEAKMNFSLSMSDFGYKCSKLASYYEVFQAMAISGGSNVDMLSYCNSELKRFAVNKA